MPKLKPATQQARRERILDAAEICFARAGFHRCTMQDICKEAGVSPGALYVYFASKEDLIAGIVERDRAKFTADLAELSKAPDLLAALAKLGEHYTMDEPHHKGVLHIEIGSEATRNPAVAATFHSVDEFCRQSFEQVFEHAAREGKIRPEADPRALSEALSILGDGLFWRRAVDPEFDVHTVMPLIMKMVSALLNPVAGPVTGPVAGPVTGNVPQAGAPPAALKAKAKVKAEAAR